MWPALEKLVDPVTRGDPESPLRWTCKSTHVLSAELFAQHGIRISDKTVAKLLRDHGYSLQAPNKSVEGAQHPDRNAQFEHINAKAQDCVERGVPVISVDTKKKELVGNFKNGGREWQPKGEPDLVDVHDFPGDASRQGDPLRRLRRRRQRRLRERRRRPRHAGLRGHVDRGVVETGRRRSATPTRARSSSPPTRAAATATGRTSGSTSCNASPTSSTSSIHVSHFPPGTSKWNKVEHRLFSFISINWRGRPLRTYETIINLIGNTTNRGGLVVRARLDRRRYPTGKKVSAKELRELKIERDDFHGDWNYVIRPRMEQR